MKRIKLPRPNWPKNSYFQRNTLVLAVSGAFTNLGAGVIGLFMPEYFRRLGGSTVVLGFMSFTVFIQFFTFLLGGFIADHSGRKKIIVLTAFYGSLFPLLYAVFQDWRLFVAISVIATFSSLSVPASQAIIADSAPLESRATGISAVQVVSSLPLIVTPLVWGWLIDSFGWRDGFRIGCIYSIATALGSAFILLFFLRETVGVKAFGTSSYQSFNLRASLSEMRRYLSTSLTALMVAYCLIRFANAAVGNYYIIYANEVTGIAGLEWGLILSLQTLLTVVLKIPGAWVADRKGKKKVLAISALTCAPLTIVFTLSHSFVEVLIVMLLLVAAGIYYDPVHQALQADLTPRSVRGRIIMLWSIGGAVASALGGLAGGFLYYTMRPATPFYLFTAAELVAVVILIVAVKEPLKKEA
jgi:MFS family permease